MAKGTTSEERFIRSGGAVTRRGLLQQLTLLLLGLPLLRLGETVARAERHRRHHRGERDEIWIGHC